MSDGVQISRAGGAIFREKGRLIVKYGDLYIAQQYGGAILLDNRVGTFVGRRRRLFAVSYAKMAEPIEMRFRV